MPSKQKFDLPGLRVSRNHHFSGLTHLKSRMKQFFIDFFLKNLTTGNLAYPNLDIKLLGTDF